jgi:hypothetical protein
MATDRPIPIEGEPSKPWQLWRTHKGEQIEKVAEGETREELAKHKRRLDWTYDIYHNRRLVPRGTKPTSGT